MLDERTSVRWLMLRSLVAMVARAAQTGRLSEGFASARDEMFGPAGSRDAELARVLVLLKTDGKGFCFVECLLSRRNKPFMQRTRDPSLFTSVLAAQSKNQIPYITRSARVPIHQSWCCGQLTCRPKIYSTKRVCLQGTMADDNNNMSPELESALAKINALEKEIALTEYALRNALILTNLSAGCGPANISQGTRL